MSDRLVCLECVRLRVRLERLEAAARLTLLPSVLERIEQECEGIALAPEGAVQMLLTFYGNVKAALKERSREERIDA